MPAKNVIKFYSENGYYHIYNRGVEKRSIFTSQTDCRMFLYYIKLYLSSIESLKLQMHPGIRLDKFLRKNLSTEVDLLAFSLMPNHFHLLIKQYTLHGIIKFMRRLTTAYVIYFNTKYKRVGPLFQGTYKAIPVVTDEYLLHLSRYIHLNPFALTTQSINYKNFSSYPNYLGNYHSDWIKPNEILNYFSSSISNNTEIFSYKNFVEDYISDQSIISDLILEEDYV